MLSVTYRGLCHDPFRPSHLRLRAEVRYGAGYGPDCREHSRCTHRLFPDALQSDPDRNLLGHSPLPDCREFFPSGAVAAVVAVEAEVVEAEVVADIPDKPVAHIRHSKPQVRQKSDNPPLRRR